MDLTNQRHPDIAKLSYAFAIALVLTGCGGSGHKTTATALSAASHAQTRPPANTNDQFRPVPLPTAIPGGDKNLYDEVLELTNSYRTAMGAAPLLVNEQLSEAAQTYAEIMAKLGHFNHTSPEGISPSDRIRSAGYQWQNWGENIAYGPQTALAVMQSWMNSSNHRANILNKSFREIGIGHFVGTSPSGSPGTHYWVQDFGTR